MTKGEESRQRLIKCAAELFWKNGYSATGISQILRQTGLPKLSARTTGRNFAGCPYAVMGMETALSKPAVASVFMEGLKKFEQIFQEVLLYSGLSPDHAKILSQRMLSIYQGYLLLGRISNNTSFLKNARKNMLEMYREYRSYHEI